MLHESTDGKVLGSDEIIKLRYTDGNIIGNILGYVDGITLVFGVGIELGSLNGTFRDSDDGTREGSFLG